MPLDVSVVGNCVAVIYEHLLLLQRRKIEKVAEALCKKNKYSDRNAAYLCIIVLVSALQECDNMLKCLLYFLVLMGNILPFLMYFHDSRTKSMNETISGQMYYKVGL